MTVAKNRARSLILGVDGEGRWDEEGISTLVDRLMHRAKVLEDWDEVIEILLSHPYSVPLCLRLAIAFCEQIDGEDDAQTLATLLINHFEEERKEKEV